MDDMVAGNIAIIPARGGSKRIVNKNIIDFNGRPMIAATIQAALETGLFHRVIVSTDDEIIAETSIAYGAEVPIMREAHADDFSLVSDATIHALRQVEKHFSEKYDLVVQLMANCPLRNAEDISDSVAAFKAKGRKYQLSCFKYGWMNPWWAHRIKPEGAEALFSEEIRMMRSQDQEELYCPTGAIWIAESEALKEAGTFYGPGYAFEPISLKSAIDIDDYDDLDMARYFATKEGK